MIIAELLGIEEDPRKNLIIWVAFSKDGIDFEFYRGSELLIYNNRKAWPLYAMWQNFLSKSPSQRLQWIKINVEDQIGNIIKEIVAKNKLNTEVKTQLVPLIGQTIQKESITVEVDLNNDGMVDAVITLKDDGTYTVI